MCVAESCEEPFNVDSENTSRNSNAFIPQISRNSNASIPQIPFIFKYSTSTCPQITFNQFLFPAIRSITRIIVLTSCYISKPLSVDFHIFSIPNRSAFTIQHAKLMLKVPFYRRMNNSSSTLNIKQGCVSKHYPSECYTKAKL